MFKKMLFFSFLILFVSNCMELEDVNAGTWYSARKVNNHYVDLLKNKCNLLADAQKHSDYLGEDLEAYFKNKYKDRTFVNATNCINSLSKLSCDNLKSLSATDIEASTFACKTTFSINNMDACVSFNYYFIDRIKEICENGDEIANKHLDSWGTSKFYCFSEYNNSITSDRKFPPRDICMSKILNLDCKEISMYYVGENIEDKLECYIDGQED